MSIDVFLGSAFWAVAIFGTLFTKIPNVGNSAKSSFIMRLCLTAGVVVGIFIVTWILELFPALDRFTDVIMAPYYAL